MERQRHERWAEFRHGMARTLPIVLGVIPSGLAYGVVAVNAGLSVAETSLMSLIVFAGSAQFMAVAMIQAGAGMLLIVASTFLINMRHLLMGLSLSPYLASERPSWHRILAFWMTDESYMATITRYRESGLDHGSPWFMFGSGFLMYANWQVCTLIGALAGNAIPDPTRWGLDFAMPATFLTMLLPQVRERRVAITVLVAAASSTAAYILIPGTWFILIGAILGTVTGVVLETLAEKNAGPGDGDPSASDEAARDEASAIEAAGGTVAP
jgi:4-azaleucine resistance transporter AzlC